MTKQQWGEWFTQWLANNQTTLSLIGSVGDWKDALEMRAGLAVEAYEELQNMDIMLDGS